MITRRCLIRAFQRGHNKGMTASKSTEDSPAVTPAEADTKPTEESSSGGKKGNVVFVNTTASDLADGITGYQIIGVSIPKKKV